MYEEFEQKQKRIGTINKTLDKLNSTLNIANDEEKKQILIYMEYLENEYKKLENEFIKSK